MNITEGRCKMGCSTDIYILAQSSQDTSNIYNDEKSMRDTECQTLGSFIQTPVSQVNTPQQ